VAGDVPLRWLDYDAHSGSDPFPWRTLITQSWSLTAFGQPASRRTIRLAVDRAGLSPAVLNDDGSGSQYQGVLRITDGGGFRRWVPVVAQVLPGVASEAAGGAGGPTPGLYVGLAAVDAVSWVTAGARQWLNEDPVDPVLMPGQPEDATSPRPTASEFAFPILLHVAGDGRHRMLHEVTMMWQPPAPPQRPNGQFVLVTPECPPQVRVTLEAGSIRDGEPFSRRFTTAAFHFSDSQGRDIDLPLTGNLAGTLQATNTLSGDHRLNPFRHLYHPDHDCTQAGECFDIARMITFMATPPGPGQFRPGFGESYFTGTYLETITGLYRGPIQVRGTYRLTLVSQIATLNAQ
jgi:hypothetical protein